MTAGGPTLVPPGGPQRPVHPDPSELAARSRYERRTQLTAAALVALALAGLGAALGVLWDLISPDSPPGIISPPGIQVDDVHEAFAGADGRFALITALVGLLAGIAAWYLRRMRGPYVAIGLAVGGLFGAMLTHLIGHVLRGTGSYQYSSGGTAFLTHLPLNVQMKGLWFLEPALATLVYSLLVAFAAADDLGRPDVQPPRRAVPAHAPAQLPPAPAQPLPERSARPQGDLQDRRRDGDGPGVP
jgi:hypothetical protein